MTAELLEIAHTVRPPPNEVSRIESDATVPDSAAHEKILIQAPDLTSVSKCDPVARSSPENLEYENVAKNGASENRKVRPSLSALSFGSMLGSNNRSSQFSTSKLYVPRKHGLCLISSLRSTPSFGFPTAPRFGNEKINPGG